MCPILITDVGTTICKSIVFEHDGVSIGKSAQGYITKRPNPLWAQQDPNTWWQSFKLTSKTALKKTRTRPNGIDCIGIIGMGHGPVLLNSRGRPIMPCLIWPDLRATRQAEELRAKVKDLGIEHSISGRVQAWYTAAKLLWIRQNYP
ncbi:MAG: FGGY family carbohydrate kinase, partial [Candidatus Bathyarchaeia archaeon]